MTDTGSIQSVLSAPVAAANRRNRKQGSMSRHYMSVVTLSTKTIPQRLFTPVSVQSSAFKHSTCNSADSMVAINECAIMPSIQQSNGTTNTSAISMHTVTKSLDVTMISHDPSTPLNTMSYNDSRQPVLTSSSGKLEYKLSELVLKYSLFQMPSYEDAYRQFFSLLEDEDKQNNLNNDKEQEQGVSQSETTNNIQLDAANKLHIQPVLGLGESPNKFNFHIHNNKLKKQNQADDSRSRRPEYCNSQSCEYEPEDNGIQYENVVQMAGIRRIRSHPELHELTELTNRMTKNGETFDPFNEYITNIQKSVNKTLLLGFPKLIRRQIMNPDQASAEIKSPGYSFLASVADELRASINARHRHEQILAHNIVEKLTNAQTAAHTSKTNTVVSTKNSDKTVAQSRNLISNSTVATSLGMGNIDVGKSQGFINALKAWALRKSINVSSKESNIICPQSF